LQKVKGLLAASLVGLPLAAWLFYSLHATVEIAALAGSAVGLAIFAVVSTGADARGTAADEAWREAAPDLPPASERAALERNQASMPGPEKGRRVNPRPRDERHGVQPGDAATPGAQPK
jgi:hypothetical protein